MKTAIIACWLWLKLKRQQRRNKERALSERRRARLRRALILLTHKYHSPALVRYALVNRGVRLLRSWYDQDYHHLRTEYRLRRETIVALIRLLPTEGTHGWGRDIMVLVTLYWLAHGMSYLMLSGAFDMPKTTAHRLVHSGTYAIAALRTEVIRFPSAHELAEVGRGFQALGNSPVFAKCVGAIDGCHIRIKIPSGPHSQEYMNRKIFASIQLQGTCDAKGRFINTFVGYPGRVNDARILRNSGMYREALYPPPGYFIVGDGGYPCIRAPITLLAPYRDPVQPTKIRYNHHHSKARCVIERTFGRLKVRWRSLLFRALEVHHTFVPAVVTACCVLHNICVATGDEIDSDDEMEDDVPMPPAGPERGEQCGEDLRDRMAAQLSAPDHMPGHLDDHNYL